MLYDGGFGSRLFVHGIELSNSALANELHPDTVVEIHRSYIEAGADAIGTNTFVASPLHMEMAGKAAGDVDEIVRAAVRHAQAAVAQGDRNVYIAGSIGPSPGAIETDSGDTDFGIADDRVREAHDQVGRILVEEGIDLFCLETMFSANEAAIAVDVLRRFGLPIAVNLTYKYTRDRQTGKVVYRTDWGHSADSVLEILASGRFSDGDDLLEYVQVLGLNCGAESRDPEHTGMPYAINGTRQLHEAMAARAVNGKRMMAYPNAGIPTLDENRRTVYSQTPEKMVSYVSELLNEGAYIFGGCCGTGPDHIRAFRNAIDQSFVGV